MVDTRAFADSVYGDRQATLLSRRGFPRQFRIVTYGDSKSNLMGGLSALNSSLRVAMLHWPIDFVHDPSTDTTGVSGKQVSTTSTHLADDTVMAPMLARFAAGRNVMIFKGFTNDSGATVATDMAAFQKIVEQARAAGCKLFIVMGLNPDSTLTTAVARKFESIDQALRQYQRMNDDVWYVPTTLALLDTTSTDRDPLADYMTDGTHESNLGAWIEGVCLAREFQRRGVPRRYPSVISPADAAYGPKEAPQSPLGNMFGAMGTFSLTSNSSGMRLTNSGSGSLPTASDWVGPSGDADNYYMRLSGALTGTVSLSITTEDCDYLNEDGLQTTIQRPVLNFSGTTGGSGMSITVSCLKNIFQVDSTSLPYPINFEREFAWYGENVTGLAQIRGPGSNGFGSIPATYYPTFTGLMLDLSPLPFAAGGDATFGTYEDGFSEQFDFAPSVDLTGTKIQLIGVGVRQVYPLQTAAS